MYRSAAPAETILPSSSDRVIPKTSRTTLTYCLSESCQTRAGAKDLLDGMQEAPLSVGLPGEPVPGALGGGSPV